MCNYYCQRPNVIKFTELMSTHNETILKKNVMFIVKIYDAVCPPWYTFLFLSIITYLNCLWPVCKYCIYVITVPHIPYWFERINELKLNWTFWRRYWAGAKNLKRNFTISKLSNVESSSYEFVTSTWCIFYLLFA